MKCGKGGWRDGESSDGVIKLQRPTLLYARAKVAVEPNLDRFERFEGV